MEKLLNEADAWVAASDRGEEPPPPDFTIPEDFCNGSVLVSTTSTVAADINASPWIELKYDNDSTCSLTTNQRSKGYGWYAKKPIPYGTLLVISKPIGMVMDWDDEDEAEGIPQATSEPQIIDEDGLEEGDNMIDDEDDDSEDFVDDGDDEAVDEDENIDEHGEADVEDEYEHEEMRTDDEFDDNNPKENGNGTEILDEHVDDVEDDHIDDDDDDDEVLDDAAGVVNNKLGTGEEEPEPKQNEILLVEILQKLLHQPELWKNQLCNLFPRNDAEVENLPTWVCHDDTLFMQVEQLIKQLEEKQLFDKNEVQQIAKRLPSIIRYNILSVETCCELLSYPGEGGHSDLSGVGLYYLPSYFNHSRTPNCNRWAFGDVMGFVTNQDIAEGIELCISYLEHDLLCENSSRRNSMLRMDFVAADDENDGSDKNNINGPEMPVVDPDVQNELMSLNPFERLHSIDALLEQAMATTQPERENDDTTADRSVMTAITETAGESSSSLQSISSSRQNPAMEQYDNRETKETAQSNGWFQCDIHNLRILKAITFDGLGQHDKALQLWEESIQFLVQNLPPNDENLVTLHTQAALCAIHIHQFGDISATQQQEYLNKAHEHATVAVKVHNVLFGGGIPFYRRRMKRDLELLLRPVESTKQLNPIDTLWPLSVP